MGSAGVPARRPLGEGDRMILDKNMGEWKLWKLLYLFIGIAILIVIIVFFTMFPIYLWIEALASGVHVSLFSMFGMRLRRINPAKIVRALIKAQKAGLKIDRNMLEAHFLAGGNVDRVPTR